MTASATAIGSARAAVRPVPGVDTPDRLVDGWEPHRPVGDGLVRRFVFAYASSFAGPVAAMGGRVRRRDGYVLHDLGRPAGFTNGVTLLRPLPFDGWEATVTDIEADLAADRTADARELLLWSAWPTPDLTARGWQLVGHPPLLLHPRPEPSPPPPPWLRIEPVRSASRLADWERVAIEGYPLVDCQPARAGAFLDARVLRDPAFRGWVGYSDGQPVAIGTSYVAHGLHVLALGATLPSHRGRGAWQALARHRLAAFARLPAMALFSDLSRPPAERLGFLPLARWTLWSAPAAA